MNGLDVKGGQRGRRTSMVLSVEAKEALKREIVEALSGSPEVRRIVIFGSFLESSDPHDVDIAIFQDSRETYYPLAMKYRRLLRGVAARIPLDVIPVRPDPGEGPLLEEMRKGEVVYER